MVARASAEPGLGGEHGLDLGDAVAWAVTRAEPTPSVCSTWQAPRSPSARVSTWVGSDVAGGERLGEPFGGGDGLGPVEELVGLVETRA